jgi:FkbM family methyltransferase
VNRIPISGAAGETAPKRRLRELIPERGRERILNGASAVLGRLGYQLQAPSEESLNPEERRRARLLRSRGITLVLDVGASEGTYARQLRQLGFEGRIISFEPLSAPFAELERAAAADARWQCRRLALGAEVGEREINVAGNSSSSSLLEMKERHLRSAPQAAYVGTERIPIASLASIWPELVAEDDCVYLKLDVQGFELEALRGADTRLGSVDCVQAELSFVPLYEGAPDFLELIEFLGSRGFRLAGLEEGHDDIRTGEMLQADGIFVRNH